MFALVTDAFGGRGGIAQYNRDFLGSLAETGAASPIIVLPRSAPDRVATPAGVTQLQPRRGRVAYALAAMRVALKHPIDVIYCGHLYMTPLAIIVAWVAKAKLVVQMHGIETWVRPNVHIRLAVEAADLILCVSRHTRASVLHWAAVAPERVLVLPNTVSDTFTPGDGSGLRSSLRLQGKRVLLTVARMDSGERYKGHDRVIAALPQLVTQGNDVVLVIVGEGADRTRLEALALIAGVRERVRFLGAVTPEYLVEAYRMADVFVMPSTGEGFGIAFLEAMACGTPALGLAVAGACDALVDGKLGTAVTENEFCAALADVLHRRQPDACVLAAHVRARFGQPLFRVGVRQALNRLSAA